MNWNDCHNGHDDMLLEQIRQDCTLSFARLGERGRHYHQQKPNFTKLKPYVTRLPACLEYI